MERRAGGLGLIFLAGDLPWIRVVWNNFAWAVIRGIQIGMFCGRQHGTDARVLDTDGAPMPGLYAARS